MGLGSGKTAAAVALGRRRLLCGLFRAAATLLESGIQHGYLQGWPLERAARMGNACAAIVVTRHGCANFMPTLDEVSAFVAGRGAAAL